MNLQTPEDIFALYDQGLDYHNAIGLEERVAQNENFFIGRQWEGVNAPNLDKPVFNILKRSINYFVSLLISDDVGISLRYAGGSETDGAMAQAAVNDVMEEAKLKSKFRELLRDAAVDGDGCLYFSGRKEADGMHITAETVDNIHLFFGNTATPSVEAQPYILLRSLRQREGLIQQFSSLGKEVLEEITEDEGVNGRGVVTVLHLFAKRQGRVYAACCTKNVMLQPLFDTGLTRYPIALMNWDRVKNSYHGEAVVTGLIPNQIFINKTFAMAMKSVKDLSFPKVVYDSTRIRRWNNEVGSAIPVAGNPNEAIAAPIAGTAIPSQVIGLVDKTIAYTRELMGATNAALGDVSPNNTSAIIAVQKASSMPLDLQKQAFYQLMEDVVLLLLDMMGAYFGKRTVVYEDDKGKKKSGICDFDALRKGRPQVTVDIGASSYFSETMQMQTLDNLYQRGIIHDPVAYLSAVPTGYIRNKGKLIRDIQEQTSALEEGRGENGREE